jgi:hypothetical protein
VEPANRAEVRPTAGGCSITFWREDGTFKEHVVSVEVTESAELELASQLVTEDWDTPATIGRPAKVPTR